MKQCEKYAENLALYLDGILSDQEQEEVMGHVEKCPECARRLEMYRILMKETKEMWVHPPESLHARIMEAVAEQKGRKRKKAFFGGVGPFTAASAAAAVILFLVGGVFGDLGSISLFGGSKSAGSADMAPRSAMYSLTSDQDESGSGEAAAGAASGDLSSQSAADDAGEAKIAAAPNEAAKESLPEAGEAPDAAAPEESAPQKNGASAGSAPDENQVNDRSPSLKFSIAGDIPAVLCPEEVPLDGSFALVMVASGDSAVADGTIKAKREKKDEGIDYFAVQKDDEAVRDMEESLTEQGFLVTYFYEGADYIDAASSEVLVVVRPE